MNIEEQASRLEQILQWDIAQEIISQYKYTFAEGSYYYLICRQVEKMLIDSIFEQQELINQETDNNANQT
jgi:hypothetical protein